MSITDVPTCTGHGRMTKKPCTQPAVNGKTKCRLHGGKSLSGPAAGGYKTGKYSKVLPVRLLARYEEARTNPRLLSLADDIAAAEARLADLFQRVDSGESGALWQSLQGTLDAFNAALARNDLPAMQGHLATIRSAVAQGCEDSTGWTEIQELWKTRCLLTQTETKTLIAMQQMISTEQLMVYLGVVTHAIRRSVTAHADTGVARNILQDLSTEFERLTICEAGYGPRS